MSSDTDTQSAGPRVVGTVKWFNVTSGYGFINRTDTGEDIFVHKSAIKEIAPDAQFPSLKEEEEVEFNVGEGRKGAEATNVTGIGGKPVIGSSFVPMNRGRGRGFGSYRGDSGGFRDGFNQPGRDFGHGGFYRGGPSPGRPYRGRGGYRGRRDDAGNGEYHQAG